MGGVQPLKTFLRDNSSSIDSSQPHQFSKVGGVPSWLLDGLNTLNRNQVAAGRGFAQIDQGPIFGGVVPIFEFLHGGELDDDQFLGGPGALEHLACTVKHEQPPAMLGHHRPSTAAVFGDFFRGLHIQIDNQICSHDPSPLLGECSFRNRKQPAMLERAYQLTYQQYVSDMSAV